MSQRLTIAKAGAVSVAEAKIAMQSAVRLLEIEHVPLEAASGRVLAADVTSTRDQPPFDASAMDGYALFSGDTPGDFRLIGESAAGLGFAGVVGTGETVRISTGAAVPHGTDAIAIQENVVRTAERIQAPTTPAGQFVRPRGGDFGAGTLLLRAGRVLDPIGIALAAACSLAEVAVSRRPRVAILSSGNELVAPGGIPGPWQVFDSATHGVAGLARRWNGEVERLAIARDDLSGISQAAEDVLCRADILIVIGGASVGDHDMARPALRRLGFESLVETVAVRPGKPTWFGTVGSTLVLGLPGNPASALVCSYLFLRPLLAAMQGQRGVPGIVNAVLSQPIAANGSREHYLRARLTAGRDGRLSVHAFEDQDSSLLSIFSAANSLIRMLPNSPAQKSGALIEVLPLDDWHADA